MTDLWPDGEHRLLFQFVDSLTLKHATTSSGYRSILRPFQEFVERSSPGQSFGPETIVAWLRAQSATCAVARVRRHAQVIDRFLEWLVARSALTGNPVAELRQRCAAPSVAALARAFRERDPEAYLAKLQPAPAFASHLGPALRDHVTRMQSLGFRYSPERFLHFDRFLQARPAAASEAFSTLVQEYVAEAGTAIDQVKRLSVGRVVAASLRRMDPTVGHISRPPGLVRQAARQRRRPHIYTPAEVERCLAAARSMATRRSALRPHALYLMLLLAYCSGLRRGEILRLRLQDLLDDTAEVDVCESKFFKSRRLPLAASVMVELRRYLRLRQEAGGPAAPESPLFWNEVTGRGYSASCSARWLTTVLRRAGVKPATHRGGPKIHDFRHAFAVHRITDWYRRGLDVQARVPFLSAYMGHKNVRSTVTYLTMTTELLEEARRRFQPLVTQALV